MTQNAENEENFDAAPVFGFSGDSLTPHVMAETHQHHEIELNYLLSGSMTYLINGDFHTVSASRFALFWAAAPHQVIATEEVTQFFWFTIPLSWFLQWRLAETFVAALLSGHLLEDQAPLPFDPALCLLWVHGLRSDAPADLKIAQLELEARVRRIAAASGAPSTITNTITKSSADKIALMTRAIARRYLEPLTVADVAHAAALNPNYAVGLFRRTCGRTITEYIVQHRLFHAQRLLATTDETVLTIAFASGFGSSSRFHEAFKAAFGCSPAAYRKSARARPNST